VKQHCYLLLVAVLIFNFDSARAQVGSDRMAQANAQRAAAAPSAAADAAGAATGAEPPLVDVGFEPQEAITGLDATAAYYKRYPLADTTAEFAAIKKDLVVYAESQKACLAKENRANTLCIEARNPDVQKYAMFAQTLMAGLTGFTDSCSKWSKLMNMGNTALGLYQAQCGLWKGMCSSSCTKAVTSINAAKANSKKLIASYQTKATSAASTLSLQGRVKEASDYTASVTKMQTDMTNFDETYFQRELNTGGDYRSVAKKLETCIGYAKQLATSVLGAAGMVKSMAGADKCEEDSSNAPTALAGDTPVDCTIPANKANNMTCICQDAPRTPGCDSLLDSSTVAKNLDNVRAASTTDYVPNTPSGGKIDLGGDGGGLDLASKAGGGSGSSSPGAPGGGRGAGIDGGGGGGSGPAGSPAVQKSALNTNILGGEGGGGGGGGSWGSGGGDDGLRQYLPGGAKDPAAQGLAGQGSGATGVTGPAGKSNWEKVRERYRDNKRSLLNN